MRGEDHDRGDRLHPSSVPGSTDGNRWASSESSLQFPIVVQQAEAGARSSGQLAGATAFAHGRNRAVVGVGNHFQSVILAGVLLQECVSKASNECLENLCG